MEKQTLSEAFLIKARELKVEPKLLLFIAAGIAENPMTTETAILKPFFDSMVADMIASTMEQKESKNPTRRTAAETALKPLATIDIASNDAVLLQLQSSNFLEGYSTPLYLHYAAFEYYLKNRRNLLKLKKGNTDLIQIVKEHCQELIQRLGTNASIFQADMSFN
jgi:hypothetical protein